MHVDVAVPGGLAVATAALALARITLGIALIGTVGALGGSGALDRLGPDLDRADRLDRRHDAPCEPRLGAACWEAARALC